MPRKSAAALTVVAVDGRASRLKPPPTLSEPERRVFVDIVSACNPGHFHACDLPLLARYCEAAALGDLAAIELRRGAVIDGKPSPWIVVQEKAVRAMVVPEHAAALVTAKPLGCEDSCAPTDIAQLLREDVTR